jgi:hypothetical protein
MVFAIAARLIRDGGLQAARAFIVEVNAHIDALTSWEERRTAFAGETALRGTLEPERCNCDSDAAFESVHRLWTQAQAVRPPCPAPSAPIRVERAIEVLTDATGARTYKYLDDEWWGNSVYRDHIIQRNKEI